MPRTTKSVETKSVETKSVETKVSTAKPTKEDVTMLKTLVRSKAATQKERVALTARNKRSRCGT